jgi:hypothetical protein
VKTVSGIAVAFVAAGIVAIWMGLSDTMPNDLVDRLLRKTPPEKGSNIPTAEDAAIPLTGAQLGEGVQSTVMR